MEKRIICLYSTCHQQVGNIVSICSSHSSELSSSGTCSAQSDRATLNHAAAYKMRDYDILPIPTIINEHRIKRRMS